MNSKLNRPQSQTPYVATNQLRRSAVMDPLQGIGYLSNLHPENRNQGPPLPTTYLQQAGRMNNGPYQTAPPPLPPHQNTTTMNRYGGYPGMNRYPGMNNYYSPLGMSRYSSGMYGSSMYSPYSNYRMPYGQYGAPNDAYSSFLQMAEESTRPAFESIESVVQIVNSISMMLESTYGAVHGSYSAILGVVDQFSRLKDHFAQVFSVLAMLKGLHYLCLKVLYLLGLRKGNPSVEEAWQTAHEAAVTGDYPSHSKGSTWPFFMFLSLVVGAPWLMFKLLSKNAVKKPLDPKLWVNADGKSLGSYAAYDFAATQADELSFRAGELLKLFPKDVEEMRTVGKNWILACNSKKETGLVPVNYLKFSRVPNTRRPTTIPQPQAPTQVPSFFNLEEPNGDANACAAEPDASNVAPASSIPDSVDTNTSDSNLPSTNSTVSKSDPSLTSQSFVNDTADGTGTSNSVSDSLDKRPNSA